MNYSKKLVIALVICTVLLITMIGFIVHMETRQPIESDGTQSTSEVVDMNDANDLSATDVENTEPAYSIYYAMGALSVYSDTMASKQIGTIQDKAEVKCYEVVDDFWMKIDYDGTDAYVFREYLSDTLDIVLEEEPSEPVYFEDEYGNVYLEVNEEVRATGNVHVRVGPSMRFAKLGVIGDNGKVTRIGVGENGWSKVIYHGVEGYVTSYYLTTTKTATYEEVNETVYAIKTANIRTGPTIEYNKIGELEEGVAITRIGIGDNGWSKVLYNGEEAYMYSLYLTPTPIVAQEDSNETEDEVVEENMDEDIHPEDAEIPASLDDESSDDPERPIKPTKPRVDLDDVQDAIVG